MDNKKKKKLIITLIALAVVLFLIILIILNRPSDTTTPTIPTDTGGTGLPIATEPGQEDVDEFYEDIIYSFDEDLEESRVWDQEDFKRMAKSFAELFGTYSNFSNFENIELSREYMTPSLRAWADSYVLDLRENFEYSGEYYALKSESFSEPVVRNFNSNSSEVEVIVSLERTETMGDNNTRSFSQDLLVVFAGSENNWKVDGVYWQ